MAILDMFSLKGKVALVTGGASGYGRQIAQALVEAGAETWAASRKREKLERLRQEYASRGMGIRVATFDQADEATILALRDLVVSTSGGLDILVNNAVVRPMRQGWDDTVESFTESMRVNAAGLFAVTRIMGKVMAERGAGSIINIGSIMGIIGLEPANYRGAEAMRNWSPDYFFHKGGMANFTRLAASYFGQYGVRCNCVHPGGLRTPSHPEPFVRNYSERTCLGRLADDTDLMGIIVFLASDASRYITGANIPVDGGYTAK